MKSTSYLFGEHYECGYKNRRAIRTHEMLDGYRDYCEQYGFEYRVFWFDLETDEIKPYSPHSVSFVDDPDYI